ncbi:hypothetical protein LPUS_07087 [Lasallia pustulata]|uniref:Uncharacterized protein n=1 Tax=Lasallia pustulata TaxID=136370 RepID=A0A1W5D2B6_9LECA|nr:hypothetical protein LPUS_07087 [Lasallia pustulata]
MASPRASPFPFLSLPPELRNKVYFHLLHFTKPIHSDRTGNREFCHRPRKSSNAGCALIRTCKIIAVEATSVLYRSNKFRFSNRTYPYFDIGIYAFLRSIGPDNRAMIRHLIIEILYADVFSIEGEEHLECNKVRWARQFLKAMELLQQSHRLEIFEINVKPLLIKNGGEDEYNRLFSDRTAKGIQEMSKIKGLRGFTILEWKDEWLEKLGRKRKDEAIVARDTIQWLRKEMTAPKVEAVSAKLSDE